MIEGTSSNPKFVPDIQGMMGSQLKSTLGGLGGKSPAGQNADSVVNAVGGLFGGEEETE